MQKSPWERFLDCKWFWKSGHFRWICTQDVHDCVTRVKITKLQQNIHGTFWVSFCYRKLSFNLQYSLLKLLIIFQIIHNQNRLPVLKLDEQALYLSPFAVCLHSATTRSTKTHQKSHCWWKNDCLRVILMCYLHSLKEREHVLYSLCFSVDTGFVLFYRL